MPPSFFTKSSAAVGSVCSHNKPPAQVAVHVNQPMGAGESVFTLVSRLSAVRLFVVRRSDKPQDGGSNEEQGANDPALSRARDQCTEKQPADEAGRGPTDTASDRKNNSQRPHHCCNTSSTTLALQLSVALRTYRAHGTDLPRGGCSILEHLPRNHWLSPMIGALLW
jgi:hypothetical protein